MSNLVFVFEGPTCVDAFSSVARACAHLEAVDVRNGEYEVFGADGTVITARVDEDTVVLTPTVDRRPDELRQRLRTFLEHPKVDLDPALSEDPKSLAAILLVR